MSGFVIHVTSQQNINTMTLCSWYRCQNASGRYWRFTMLVDVHVILKGTSGA